MYYDPTLSMFDFDRPLLDLGEFRRSLVGPQRRAEDHGKKPCEVVEMNGRRRTDQPATGQNVVPTSEQNEPFRVSRNPRGGLQWWCAMDLIPRNHTGVRQATSAETIVMRKTWADFEADILPTDGEIAALDALMESVA